MQARRERKNAGVLPWICPGFLQLFHPHCVLTPSLHAIPCVGGGIIVPFCCTPHWHSVKKSIAGQCRSRFIPYSELLKHHGIHCCRCNFSLPMFPSKPKPRCLYWQPQGIPLCALKWLGNRKSECLDCQLWAICLWTSCIIQAHSRDFTRASAE